MKTKNIYIFVFFILSFASCSDFLSTEMTDRYSSENYYTSSDAASMEVTGIYNSLYGIKWWIFGDVASDDAVKGGNAGDQADIDGIDNFSATADNGVLATYWQACYETVSRANNAVFYIPQMSDQTETLKRLVGEAKFLRAFSYFNLVNTFGDVPLKTLPQTSSNAIHVGLSDVSEIYSQIESDLADAINVLPSSYSTEQGRVTKGAAYALMAKVKLYREEYEDCLLYIDSLESLNIYSLETNYADLFKEGAEDSQEVIWGLRFINGSTAVLGNEFDVWMAPAHEGGYYFNAPTQDYVDAFIEQTTTNEDDPRLDASIGRDGKAWFNDTVFSSSWSEATGYLVKKYNTDDTDEVAKAETTVPCHNIRYADVLLMKAEALNELNYTTAAAEVDKVRSRANLAPTTAASQADLRTIIRNERRKELGFEFHRFFDLMRWGKDAAEEALGEDFTWEEPRFYFPIPQAEADANQAL